MRPLTTLIAGLGSSAAFLLYASTASATITYETSSIPHSPVPAGSGTVSTSAVFLGDDDYEEMWMYSSFTFFGVEYSSLHVSSNGYVSFGVGSSESTSAPIPDPAQPNNIIAAWWEDLHPGAGGTITFDEFPNQAVVTFDGVPHYPTGAESTFQIKMIFDGSVEIHFTSAISDGGTHSIGVEDESGTIGHEFFRGTTSIPVNSAIRFVPVDVLFMDGFESGDTSAWGGTPERCQEKLS